LGDVDNIPIRVRQTELATGIVEGPLDLSWTQAGGLEGGMSGADIRGVGVEEHCLLRRNDWLACANINSARPDFIRAQVGSSAPSGVTLLVNSNPSFS